MRNQEIFARLKSILGIIVLQFWYQGPFIGTFLMIFCSNEIRILLLLLLVYQYCFSRKTDYIQKLFEYCSIDKYFEEFQVVWEEPLDNQYTKNIVCAHPHGCVALSLLIAHLKDDNLKQFKACGSKNAIYIPFGGIIHKWYGTKEVESQNFQKYMENQENIMFLPGGYEEATITEFKKDKVFVRNRKGFIKYCLKYGYSVIPCYAFGETDLFNTFQYQQNYDLGLFLNKFKIPFIIFWGKFFTLPNQNARIKVVIGKNLQFPQIAIPSKEQIDQYHQLYVKNLIRLYEKYKLNSNDEIQIL